MSPNYAYVTLSTSKSYLLGIMAMYLSLKKTGTGIPLYAMLPTDLIKEESDLCDRMKANGIMLIEYSDSIPIPQQLIESNENHGDSRFSHTFDKLLVFEQTQFDKIVYLDADIYILHNLDHLFSMPHMSAMIAGRSYPGNKDWTDLTSGIMTIVPQHGLIEQFQVLISEVMRQKGACGDQDILQAYYSDWTQHPELDMGEKYGVIAGYASYYEKNLGYRYTNVVDDPQSVALIHYAGEKKPWMQHWGFLSVLKQELQLLALKAIHKRNTTAVLLEYKHLIRKARKLLYAK